MPVVDFTDVEISVFDPVPGGRYLVNVTEAEIREGQESGVPYLALTLNVIDGDYEGRKLWDNMSFSPKALWKLKGFLLASGYEEDDVAGEFEVDPDEFLEAEYDVVVGVSKDSQGTSRNNIRSYTVA